MAVDFERDFKTLTGHEPFPWQRALFERFISDRDDNIPKSCDLPTGLGKTTIASTVIAIVVRPDAVTSA